MVTKSSSRSRTDPDASMVQLNPVYPQPFQYLIGI
uniref:Uncharacterized protein n=1 Tax=Tetranychus urticae TaxID=32264 RepID=T1K2J5_TETUR